jgi:ABC-type uncharacterized transport system permease subunit
MNFFNVILPSAIGIAIIYLFGCVGEIITEKSGHLNLGIPGVMCFGAVGGVFGVFVLGKASATAPWIVIVLMTLLFSALISCIAALIYGFLTVTLKCNQNVTGLALTTFGAGVADFFMPRLMKAEGIDINRASKLIRLYPEWADNIGAFGKIFFAHGILVYLAIIIAIVTAIVLKRTRVGLSLRAVGENPATADAAGINVIKYKYAAIFTGSIVAGFAGLFYVMDQIKGAWSNSSTIQAFGWLAIALVIFCVWRSGLAILGSIIFAFLYIFSAYVNVSTVMTEVLKLLPYFVTVVVLIITSIIGKKGVQPPSSLGLSYFREER